MIANSMTWDLGQSKSPASGRFFRLDPRPPEHRPGIGRTRVDNIKQYQTTEYNSTDSTEVITKTFENTKNKPIYMVHQK